MAFPECMNGEGPIVETIAALCCDPFFDVIEISHIRGESARRQVVALAEQARCSCALARNLSY